MIAVLGVGSLLSIAYLLPVPVRAFFASPLAGDTPSHAHEPPLAMLLPICATALGCILLFFFAHDIYNFLLNVPLLPPEGGMP